jgi:hypothetical protein
MRGWGDSIMLDTTTNTLTCFQVYDLPYEALINDHTKLGYAI